MSRPLPPLDDSPNGAFWKQLARSGELRFQRCADCGAWRHPPRHLCASCGSARAEWQRSSGRGALLTWTVTHQAFHPAFAPETPYATVVTELEEGVRLVSGVRELPLAELRIGLPVEVLLERADGERLLPFVRPVESLVRDRVLREDLESGYAAMAADESRESAAFDWAEATLADVDDEAG